MNKARRKEIARADALIAEAVEILTACRDEEQDYFDNMPESFQGGDKGMEAEAVIDALDEAVSQLEEAQSSISEYAGG